MSGSRGRALARRGAFLVATAAVAAACATAPYREVAETSAPPRLSELPLATTTPTTATTATTEGPRATSTTVERSPVSTPALPPASTPSTDPGVDSSRQLVTLGSTGVRMEFPAGWQGEPKTDPRTLLAVFAPALAPSGLFDHTCLVVARRVGNGSFTPSVVAFERPRARSDTAVGVLTELRSLIGARAASSVPMPEPSRIGNGAYVTYQFAAAVESNGTDIVSEHYAFVRPTSVLVLTMTTTTDNAATDGQAFGRMLTSLRLES